MTTVVSEQWMKQKSGEFDLESVYTLDLSNQGLSSLGSLTLCSQLCVLDLSHNHLSSVEQLCGLAKLESLDLSANQITSLNGLGKLESLHTLNLAGNSITSLDGLLPLASLYNLHKLTLSHSPLLTPSQQPHLTNPVCSLSSYREFKESPHNYIPSLNWLDGELVGGVFHTSVQRICEGGGSCDDVEKSTDQSTGKLDPLPDPLEELSIDDGGTTTKELSELLTLCHDVTRQVNSELTELYHTNEMT